MEIHETTNEILNDLVKINNDRIAVYENAIKESKDLDIDLKATFEGMIRESSQYKEELSALIQKNEGVVEDNTTSTGDIYRAWMDIKATFKESDRHSILCSCEFEEDAVQRAYDAALSSASFIAPDVRQLVSEEQAALKKSHDLIKKQCDAHKALVK